MPEQRRAAIVLLGLMLVGMILETLGIGLVIPAIALMTKRELVDEYPALAPWLNSIGNPSHERLIIAGMLTFVGVHAVKAMFLLFLAWRQACFASELHVELSQRLFVGYLRQPYTFHLQRNSAQLIYNTIDLTSNCTSAIQQSLTLITEVLVLIGVSTLLLSLEPVGTLLILTTIGLASWIFNRVSRNHIQRWGQEYQYHAGLRIQHLQQGLGAVKDVKLLGREGDFLAQYRFRNASSAKLFQRQATLGALPRLWLEFLSVTGLAVLILVTIGQGKPMEALLPTLGLFAAAAFRLTPSVNRVLGAIQSVRFTFPMIDTLHSEFQLLNSKGATQIGEPLPFNEVLTIDQVSFRYPSTEDNALRAVSLSISRGTSVGFVGGSGAGKSTIVDIILGLLTPLSGTLKVDGIDIQTSIRGWQDQIGYVPQSIFLTDDTLRRNVAFGLPFDQIDETAVRRAIAAAQLEQFVNDLPQGLDTLVGERGIRLSGGQRQRIGIARALYHDPAVLVLDEATSSLDTTTERDVMEAVRALRGNKTILIVAHRLSTVEHCDRLFRFEKGRMVDEGETAEMLRKVSVALPEVSHG